MTIQNQKEDSCEDVMEIISHMPASNVSNYFFTNNHDLTFKNNTKPAGLDRPSNSNGAAYADLDNDGDLDLIVNNIDSPAFIYQNNTKENHSINIELNGEKQNSHGIGAKIKIKQTINGLWGSNIHPGVINHLYHRFYILELVTAPRSIQ